MQGHVPIAFWLIPAPSDHARLSAVIQTLARAHHAPAFEPHVSLHVGEFGGENLGQLLRRVAVDVAPFDMRAGWTAHGKTRFKTLYVEFDDARPAMLGKPISAGLRSVSAYALTPHLSLLYRKSLDEAVRQRLAAQHNLRGQLIRFDTLAAVLPGRGQLDFSDVASWDARLRVRLG